MNSSNWFDTISLGWSITHFKGLQVRLSKLRCTSVPEDCVYSANITDPDEMPHDAAFHLGLLRLQNYSFRGFLYTKS